MSLKLLMDKMKDYNDNFHRPSRFELNLPEFTMLHLPSFI